MRVSETDILMLPGWKNAGPDHWLSRWEAKLSTARRVVQDDWETPRCGDWVSRIIAAVAAAERPVVLVGHSCGAIAAVHAAHRLQTGQVRGAFLVAPPWLEGFYEWPASQGGFHPVPMQPLPFATEVVASRTDPYCTFAQARDYANAWGVKLHDAGEAGHITAASGQGPWPEGSLAFAHFLRSLE